VAGDRLEDFDYPLPEDRIAQEGVEPRDAARMLAVHRDGRPPEHRRVRDLPDYLRPGDVLVLNRSRVIPARLLARKATGARIEVLLVREEAPSVWLALLRPARKAPPGTRLVFSEGEAEVVGLAEEGLRRLRFFADPWRLMARAGRAPLPPYIRSQVPFERYQTIFAKVPGSVAAPTAGLHFTPELLERVEAAGAAVRFLSLHVGPGTFRPIRGPIETHRMHEEVFCIPEATAEAVSAALAEGRRVVAVGTTVVRALESAYRGGAVAAGPGATRLFIRPGYRFRVVGALLTNFHLPRSTLLLLVAAFAGYRRTMDAYRRALASGYRFYSLGDAMWID